MLFFTDQDQLQFVQSTNEIQGHLNTAVPFSGKNMPFEGYGWMMFMLGFLEKKQIANGEFACELL